MFSEQAASAYLSLQSKALSAGDNYTLSRVERALDEILRNPQNTNPTSHQIRSAWANAGKVLHRRRKLAPEDSVNIPRAGDPFVVESGFAVVEINDWLKHAEVSTSERRLLRRLADGGDARTLANSDGIEVQRMRERISRARRTAAAEYVRMEAAA